MSTADKSEAPDKAAGKDASKDPDKAPGKAPVEPGPRSEGKVPLRDFSMLIALVGIFVFFGLASPTFVSARNLSNLAVELSITSVLALGILMIIVTSQMDLSVGQTFQDFFSFGGQS